MKLIDSCGWLEFFVDGPLARAYEKVLLPDPEEILVPSIVLYEVFKFLLRTSSEETAIRCTAHMTQGRVIELDSALAVEAAEASLAYGLAMADAIVFTTARKFGADLFTSDADLKGLEGVTFLDRE